MKASSAKTVAARDAGASGPRLTCSRWVNCNLCGADDVEVVFPRGYAQLHQIVRCRRCGLMYANPQEHVDSEESTERSSDEIYDPTLPCHQQYYLKQQVQLPDNVRALRVLNKLFPGRGRLLEIGTFAGIFLNRIRADGWEVTGLEPDRAVGSYARTAYGLNIVQGVLPNPLLKEGSFDVVVLQHVIEHMSDPAANLREIRRLLRPGGVFVVETPRFNSLLFKILGRRERSIQNCPGHIFFFTEKTLRGSLERNGFKVFQTQRVGRTLTLDRLTYNVGLVTRSPKAKWFLARLSEKLRFSKFHVYLNCRDMQRMFARAV
jgi:SAM-dependent methyltransferase